MALPQFDPAPTQLDLRVLVVDGDTPRREELLALLHDDGIEAEGCATAAEARNRMASGRYAALLADSRLPDGAGTELLEELRQEPGAPAVILAEAFGTVEAAVRAMRRGAFDYLTRPLLDQETLISVRRALEKQELEFENLNLKARLGVEDSLDRMIGRDSRMRAIFDLARSVAATRATVMISGESGTGKTLMARAVHRLSDRRTGPFVELACGALPETLLESELFGHARGAFTGAQDVKKGRFETAHEGSLFLDEVATASPAMQVKLLRFIQERTFERVGETRTRKADVRLILATNSNLEEAVRRGEFRQDLYYRVNVVHLQLPPLRERTADILPLARLFLARFAKEHARTAPRLTRPAARHLLEFPWPGNVRQLENALERALLLCRESSIRPEDLPGFAEFHPDTGSGAIPIPQLDADCRYKLKELLEEPERRILRAALDACGGNRERAAELLGINRATLFAKLRKLGINAPRSQRRA